MSEGRGSAAPHNSPTPNLSQVRLQGGCPQSAEVVCASKLPAIYKYTWPVIPRILLPGITLHWYILGIVHSGSTDNGQEILQA